MHSQRSEGTILTVPWKTTEQDRFCYLFGEADQFKWVKLNVWLKQGFFQSFASNKTVIGFGSCEVRHLTWARVTLRLNMTDYYYLLYSGMFLKSSSNAWTATCKGVKFYCFSSWVTTTPPPTQQLRECLPEIFKAPSIDKGVHPWIGQNQKKMDISGPVNKITTAGTAEIGYIDTNTRRKVARQEEGQHYHKGLGHFLFPSTACLFAWLSLHWSKESHCFTWFLNTR